MTESAPASAAPSSDATPPAVERPLTDAARRALAEAEARRAAASVTDLPPEDGGPRGPEPTRYGDWEKKGLAIDF
ncbi:DUF1674 domain-containing protein [Brevundimonas sp. R86498]|uniref:DUF1674 domain-containing protein n=1 Tax=Brevundimonas sp. R86498 TaxID=3093845 RepID=UPI0037C83FC8